MAASDAISTRQERAAKNQILFREVNERIKDINDRFHAYTIVSEWLCECANESCSARLELTAQEYEHVRAAGDQFLVLPGDEHVWPEAERVVERRANFWMVKKLEVAAEIAIDADPRSSGSTSLHT